jgi:ATP-binding cassette, subfamily B, multidrug efflux pump
MKELKSLNVYFWKYKWHLLGGIAFVNISNYFRILQPQVQRDAINVVDTQLEIAKSKNQTSLIDGELGHSLLMLGITVLTYVFLCTLCVKP